MNYQDITPEGFGAGGGPSGYQFFLDSTNGSNDFVQDLMSGKFDIQDFIGFKFNPAEDLSTGDSSMDEFYNTLRVGPSKASHRWRSNLSKDARV